LSSSLGGVFTFYPGLEWNWTIALNVLPLTFIWLGMMAASNICLRYTEVTFYQVVRGLTILFSLLFQQYQFPEFVVGTERSLACFVVIVGFIAGSIGEINFNWPGFFSGVISSMLLACYNNQIKKALAFVDGNSWRLMLYNTTIGVIICIPVLYLTGELVFNDEALLERFLSRNILIGTLGCGILGYLINFAIFLQIQLTSPLTGTISGTVKAGVQALLGWLIFRNEISSLNLAGILLVLGGSGYYSWVGYKSMQNKGKEEVK
jgi:GDP-fucose transporter C1